MLINCGAFVVMMVLLVSGAGKLLEWTTFRLSLETWLLMPNGLRAVVAVALPASEIVIALAWMLNLSRRKAAAAAVVAVASYTAFYGMHVVFSEPPACRYIALIERYWAGRVLGERIMYRNAMLLCLVVPAAVWSGSGAVCERD
ncbi:MAG: MauE/DoxX family redox-associated membrane protein [Phycisphaerales bacterium]